MIYYTLCAASAQETRHSAASAKSDSALEKTVTFRPFRSHPTHGVCYNSRMENLTPTAQMAAEQGNPRRAILQKTSGLVLIGVAFAAMLWQLVSIYTAGMRHVTHGLLLIAGICIPLAAGSYLYTRALSTREERRHVVRISFFALFAFYLMVLLGALILSRVDYFNFTNTSAAYWEQFDLMTNFNPFETVRLYLNAIKYNYIGMEIPLSNLIGNAMLFMPMAIFLPCLFRSMQKLWLFALTMFLVLVAVEALQLILACGSCDVDDVILNLFGTLIVFGFTKLPFIKRLLQRLYLLPEASVASETETSTPTA